MLLISNLSVFNNLANYTPLEQFEIYSILGYFFTNANLYLFLPLLFIVYLYQLIYTNTLLVGTANNFWSHFFEIIIEQIILVIVQNLNVKLGQHYFTWLVLFFLSICSWNLIGMVPYAFTTTSHIIVTLAMSFVFFGSINIRTIYDDFFALGRLFAPNSVPFMILPFLSLVEMISYIARLLSLAIRLFANIMAGHTLLKILIAFTFSLVQNAIEDFNWILVVLSILPFIIVFMITFLEIAIAILQAYVFLVLLCLYIKDLNVAH